MTGRPDLHVPCGCRAQLHAVRRANVPNERGPTEMSESNRLPRAGAWWSGDASDLLVHCDEIVGTLARRAAQRGLPVRPEQERAWQSTADLLEETFREIVSAEPAAGQWGVLLEYEIPRRSTRPDLVVLVGGSVVVIELKVGATGFDRSDRLQAQEYALDLADFHEKSRGLSVVPVLLATNALDAAGSWALRENEEAICATPASLVRLLRDIAATSSSPQVDRYEWETSRYRPTPTIVQAARDVFAGHEVRAIGLSYANNLEGTLERVGTIVRESRAGGRRSICFVTGVPGSGKTLAGLTAIHEMSAGDQSDGLASYLSGNGPLVDVLRYAIAKDLHRRERIPMPDATRKASVLIQPMHRFVGENQGQPKPPTEHVIVFDEAQRAWDEAQMVLKNRIAASEAAVTLEIMARPPGWSTIVALVGEGQEINNGEAGLAPWIDALSNDRRWDVYASPAVARRFPEGCPVSVAEELHLDVSVRSPRARALAAWVDAVLSGDVDKAKSYAADVGHFRLLMTRDLESMKDYLRDGRGPDRRSGLLASSQARRLRAFGIEMSGAFQGDISWPRWFVDEPDDIRSSDALEVAASEFKCQGLELDLVGLCWGPDLTRTDADTWRTQRLVGGRLVNDSRTVFALNRYRVLLTRARLGMVIWIPQPKIDLPLIDSDALDRTADYLRRCGVNPLE